MNNITGSEVFLVSGECEHFGCKELYNKVVFSTLEKSIQYVLEIADKIDGLLDRLNDENGNILFSILTNDTIYIFTIRRMRVDHVVNEYGKEIEL